MATAIRVDKYVRIYRQYGYFARKWDKTLSGLFLNTLTEDAVTTVANGLILIYHNPLQKV